MEPAPPPRPSPVRRFVLQPFGYILGYSWASPNTILGLCFILPTLLTGGGVRVQRGAIEIYSGFARWFLRKICGGAGGMTLGHVILAQDRPTCDHVRDHEHVHVVQYMWWGPLFLPAYALSSFLCWRRGKNPYFDNIFEVEAHRKFPC